MNAEFIHDKKLLTYRNKNKINIPIWNNYKRKYIIK